MEEKTLQDKTNEWIVEMFKKEFGKELTFDEKNILISILNHISSAKDIPNALSSVLCLYNTKLINKNTKIISKNSTVITISIIIQIIVSIISLFK